MSRNTVGKIFKAAILITVSALFWLPVEKRSAIERAVVPYIPESVREKLSLEKPRQFFATRLPSAEKALEASREATREAVRSLIDPARSPEQRIAALNRIAFESKGLAREIRALIESDFPASKNSAADPHSLAAYRRNFEVRIRMMALELYRGAELDVRAIRDGTLRWLAEVRQSGGNVDQTINKMTGSDERMNFVVPPSPNAIQVNVCPSAEELAAVRADFTFLEPKGESGEWGDADLTRCDRKMVAAVSYLRSLSEKLDKRVADAFDPDVLEGSPYAFTRSRVRTIRFENEDTAPNCLNMGVVAFVDPALPKTIRVCPYADQLPSALMAAHLLVHEARHIDGHPHQLCSQGAFANQFSFACDDSYEGGGSYSVGAEFYVKVLRSERVDPEVRREARYLALMDFLNRFNQLPFKLRKGALLKTKQGKLLFYDGRELAPILAGGPELKDGNWKVTQIAGLATFFDLAKGWVRSFEFAPQLADTWGDLAAGYSARPESERRKLVDAHYGFNYACLLFTNELRCGLDGEKDIVRPFARLKPIGFLQSPKSAVVPSGVLFIVGSRGELYQLPRVFAELELLSESKLKPVKENYHLRALMPWLEGFELGLRTDGTAWLYSEDNKKWSPAQRLATYRFETMVGPYYWSPELEILK